MIRNVNFFQQFFDIIVYKELRNIIPKWYSIDGFIYNLVVYFTHKII